MIPPLIILKIALEGREANALYDPGSNVTMAPEHRMVERNIVITPLEKEMKYKTMSGEDTIKGTAKIKVKIFNIEKIIRVFIVSKPDYENDLLLGLDAILIFRLCQDHKLNITQAEHDPEKVNESKSEKKNEDEKIYINWNESIPIEKFEAKVEHLDTEKREIIYKLIDKFGDLFAKDQYDIGTVKEHEAHIRLIEDKYVSKKPYRTTYEDNEEIEKQVGELLKHGMIEQSCSPFSSPVTLAFKKTGENSEKTKTRLCIDFRDLNKLIMPESQPFPLIDDIIEKTRSKRWFSAFDINSAFWSIPIRKRDRRKTGFVTRGGHYQWKSMPFGLKIAPAVFQRILSGIIRKNNLSDFCVNYIDDILVFSETFEEHMKHIEELMEAIKREGFKLKFIKCNFATHKIQYLGHVIQENAVKPLQDNLISIKNFPVPKTRKNVRQFLGKVNFYHKFIQNASRNLEPFHRLLRKNTPFNWDEKCQKAFDKIKGYLTSQPTLAIFDRNRPITIYTDASGEGIGAVLKQIQDDGMEKPVAFFSRKLNEAQKKKKAIYIESLAIRDAINFWKFWLVGRKFRVVTDHKPLQNLNLKSRTDEELGDLANYLSQYDLEVVYRPGKQNSEADCLSRNPVLESISNEEEEEILPTVNLLNIQEIKEAQKKVIKYESDVLKENVLLRKIKGKTKIILDMSSGEKLVRRIHKVQGHIGTKHVTNTIKNFYWFPKMNKIISEVCRHCEVCIRNKSRRTKRSGPMGHLGPAREPHEIMSLDTVGGFGGRRSTKKFLHILVDHFTRYAYILTSRGQTADEFIKLIRSVQNENQIKLLLTDQYGGLKANEFLDYLNSENMDHIYTAVDNPSSNGLNERLGQTLVNRIRCRINETENKNKAWSAIAQQCVKEYNATVHSVTQFEPNYLMNGEKAKIVPNEFLETSNLARDREIAFENSQRNHEYNKKRHDEKRSTETFSVGEMVYVEAGNRLNRHKLSEIRIGPYKIAEKLSETVYRLKIDNTRNNNCLYHVSKMIKI